MYQRRVRTAGMLATNESALILSIFETAPSYPHAILDSRIRRVIRIHPNISARFLNFF